MEFVSVEVEMMVTTMICGCVEISTVFMAQNDFFSLGGYHLAVRSRTHLMWHENNSRNALVVSVASF